LSSNFVFCRVIEVEVEVNLRPTVSRPCLGVRRPSGAFERFFFLLEIPFSHLRVCYFVAPSLTRGRVCIYCTIASGPCQSSHSWVEVPQNSRPYFTVSSETPPTWRVCSLCLSESLLSNGYYIVHYVTVVA
jgi:hypothetical protein